MGYPKPVPNNVDPTYLPILFAPTHNLSYTSSCQVMGGINRGKERKELSRDGFEEAESTEPVEDAKKFHQRDQPEKKCTAYIFIERESQPIS